MAGRGRGQPVVQALPAPAQPAQPPPPAYDPERFTDEESQESYLETWCSRAHPLQRKMTLSDFAAPEFGRAQVFHTRGWRQLTAITGECAYILVSV